MEVKLFYKLADWNKTDILGVTPLMKAAGCGNAYIVERLIANGADISIKDPEGFTARDYARKFR
jgi:ankyrin repeat protein